VHLRWRYHKLPAGATLEAWLAGPMVGVETHWAGSSVPCRRKLTDGALPCKWCGPPTPSRVRWIGYVPLWGRRYEWQVLALPGLAGPGAAVARG
jgi:hypothetical protein